MPFVNHLLSYVDDIFLFNTFKNKTNLNNDYEYSVIMNLNGSNLLKCGGRRRVWLELGIVASLLGAIRIQLIMMIYVEGIMLEAGLLVRYDY